MPFFDEDRPVWARAAVIAAVVALVLAVVAAVFWLGGGNGSDEPEAKESPRPSSASPSATPSGSVPVQSGASDSICGLPNGDQSKPTLAPTVVWEELGGMFFPRSDEFGPGDAAGRTCYARNPTGAVLFGLNAGVKTQLEQGTNEHGMQIAGFRIASASADRVTFDLAFRLTKGTQAGSLFSLTGSTVWVDGDWALSPDAPSDQEPVTLTGLNGFVPFGVGSE